MKASLSTMSPCWIGGVAHQFPMRVLSSVATELKACRDHQPQLPLPDELSTDQASFLLPGYIDMHAHLLFPRCTLGDGPPSFDRKLSERALLRQLQYGITTVRSPATPTVDGLRLRDDLNAGRVRGPRAFASAELINDRSLVDAQLRQAVRDWARSLALCVALTDGRMHRRSDRG